MLRDDDGVESGGLGGDGMLDELLGVELLVAGEVGEAGQWMLLVSCLQPRNPCQPSKSRNATLFGK
jgi:hypothetical protein